MPIESLVAAGAQGLSNMMSQAANAASTIFGNRAQRKWQEKMYGRQRADALADFHLQNQYNSPQEQMARLKAAGLNPNLVYGNGNAIQGASSVRSAEAGSYRPTAPQFDLGAIGGSMLDAYYNTQTRQATVDNLRAQNDNLAQEGLLKAAQVSETAARTTSILQNTEGSKFDLGQKMRLADTSAAIQEQSLRKLQADTSFTLDSNERAKAMQQPTLAKAAQEVLNLRMQNAKGYEEIKLIRAQAENLRRSGILQNLDIELRRMGINPNSPTWQQLLGRVLAGATSDDKIERGASRGGMQHMFPLLKIFGK